MSRISADFTHNEYGKIVQQKNIYHGYQSKIKVTKDSKIFRKNKVLIQNISYEEINPNKNYSLIFYIKLFENHNN